MLVTVDCGTTSHDPLAEAKALGLDPIVLDHHQAPELLPDAIVVNPNRLDDLSGLGQLCAAGVVFMTLVALQRALKARGLFATDPAPDLLATLDLVALATVADVAPLTGLNRAFVKKGLAVMRARGRPGLRALFDVAAADGPASAYHLGYLIGPRINAGGRIGDAALGARLLTLQDEDEATVIATTLDRLNPRAPGDGSRGARGRRSGCAAAGRASRRRRLDRRRGRGRVASRHRRDHRGTVAGEIRPAGLRHRLARRRWHGLGSLHPRRRSRAERSRGGRGGPAGQGRRPCDGGRHHAGAGPVWTLSATFIEADLRASTQESRSGESLEIEASLTAAGATPALVADLDRAGPYGSGNAEPVFAFPSHRVVDVARVGTNHVRLRVQSGDGATLDGIAFRIADEPIGKALLASRGERMHLAGTLAVDRYGGRERVQLRLIDAAPAR